MFVCMNITNKVLILIIKLISDLLSMFEVDGRHIIYNQTARKLYTLFYKNYITLS